MLVNSVVIGFRDSVLNSLFWDLIVTFLGAFFGFLSALGIKRLIDLKQARDDKAKKEEQYRKRIDYLSYSINEGIKQAKKQTEHYKNLIERIQQNLYDLEFPDIRASLSLHRLKELDNVSLFEAYSYFHGKNPDFLKNYKDIFTCIDFLYMVFEELKAMVERRTKFQYEDQTYVKNNMEDIFMNIGMRAVIIEKTEDEEARESPIYEYLITLIDRYKRLTASTLNFAKAKEEFFQYINDSIFPSIQHTDFSINVFYLNKKALSRLHNIHNNSIRFIKDLEYFTTSIENIISELEKHKEKLTLQ